MGLWSGLRSRFGYSDYRAWSSPYFRAREEHERRLLHAPPVGTISGMPVLERHAGGMGEVFVARHPKLGLVAVKRTLLREASRAAREQMAEEAARLIGLRHSLHLVPEDVIPDYLGGACLVVLPYCAGGSLADRAKFGAVPAAEVAHYGMILAAELDDLHGRGILHLDIKPANVLFDRAREENPFFIWRPLFSDYGLSVHLQDGAAHPQGGTPAFMAPEQAAGGEVTARSDIWSLGAVLYSLTGGLRPLVEFSAQLVHPQRLVELPPLATLDPRCPPWLSEIVAACLRIDPAERFASGKALFKAFLEHVRVTSDYPGNNGEAGIEKDAQLEIVDRYLITQATHLDEVRGGGYSVTTDLGWVTQLKNAGRLYDAGTSGPIRRALGILTTTLGTWEEPGSLLSQFARDPRAPAFRAPEPSRSGTERDMQVSLNPPVPLDAMWDMLDQKCICLVALIEDHGRAEDVAEFRRTYEPWLRTDSFGMPGEATGARLCRIAQGMRFAGEQDRAKATLLHALESAPASLLCWLAYVFTLRDTEEYAVARKALERAMAVAEHLGNEDMHVRLFLVSADLYFRAGDLDDSAELYSAMARDLRSPELVNLAAQANARRNRNASRDEVRRACELLGVSRKIEQWAAAAEVAFWAGDQETAAVVVNGLRQNPCLALPTNAFYRRLLEQIESGRIGS